MLKSASNIGAKVIDIKKIPTYIEIGLNEFTIPIDLNTRYTEESTKNVNTVTYKVNGGVVTLPFSVNNGDSLTFTVNKKGWDNLKIL